MLVRLVFRDVGLVSCSSTSESLTLSRRTRASCLRASRLRFFSTRFTILSEYTPRGTSPRPGLFTKPAALLHQLSLLFSFFGEIVVDPAVKDGMVAWSNLAATDLKFVVSPGVASLSLLCSGDFGVSPPDEARSSFSLRGVENSGLLRMEKGVGGSGLVGEGGRFGVVNRCG